MQTQIPGNSVTSDTRFVVHPITAEDTAAMAAMRAIVEPNKGRLQGTAARVPFDAIMERVLAPERVTYADPAAERTNSFTCPCA
jgi:epsilon-lactone hydrolase